MPCPTRRELMQIQLAHNHGASLPQTPRHLGVFPGNSVSVDVARCGRWRTGSINVVLQCDGNSMELAAQIARCLLAVQFACLSHCIFTNDGNKGVELGIVASNPTQSGRRQLYGREASASNKP